MRILAIILLCGALLPGTARAEYERYISPDRRFEAYTTANHADGTGMKLFVRLRDSSAAGVLLANNDRWLDVQWSPDSHFLAVGNHLDGHITDIYVFGVCRPLDSAIPKVGLYAHSPNPGTYDVQWMVAGWSLRRREVLLKKSVKFSPYAGWLRLHIGHRPLPLST